MFFTFFKTAKPRAFNYRPVYYNKEQEELQARHLKADKNSPTYNREALREELRYRWRPKPASHKKSLISTSLTVVAIFIVLYLIFSQFNYFIQ